MELNDIPLRSYDDKGTEFTFYLTNTNIANVAKLDGEVLSITDNLKVIRRFEGLRTVSIAELDNGVIAWRLARKLDPDTEAVIRELQSNLKLAQDELATKQTQIDAIQEMVDANGDVIDLLIQQSAPMEEEV